MFGAVVATLMVVVGYWILVRQSRDGRSSAPFILSALPLALLLLITPVPLVAGYAISAFQAFGT